MELMAPYLSRSYNLYIDNWYSSPTLFEKLLEANTNVVGTIRLNRKNMPKELKEKQPEKGDAIATYTHKMIAVKWPDKKRVTILTMHDIGIMDIGKTSRKTRKPVKKPKPVLDYNKGMCVCVCRQNGPAACILPSHAPLSEGIQKTVFCLFDTTLFNAYVLYKKITSQKLKYNHSRLVIQLLHELIMLEYIRQSCPAADTPVRLQAAHWAHFPQYTPPYPLKARPSRQCTMCSNKKINSSSRWECEVCKVALHVPECFKIYLMKNY